jgi:mono/diheme cytochrome c family protein
MTLRRFIKRAAIATVLVLILCTTGLAIAVVVRENRTFEAPYPDIHATTDRAAIERGRYLAMGPAHCVSCHGDAQGELSGGLAFHLPVGTVRSANLTPDVETGIGRYRDEELARVLRYGVHPTGRAVMPFMPFVDLSDSDLVAVISYLRSRPAIRHEIPPHDFTLLGRFAKAFLLEPRGPTQPIRATVTTAPTAEYGEYLVNTVANCVGCHTQRSLRTGEPTGPILGGGMEIESHAAPGQTFVSVDLRPGGHIAQWTEDAFVRRFQNAVPTASPMPWDAFAHMSEDDLRAIYRYLQTVPR